MKILMGIGAATALVAATSAHAQIFDAYVYPGAPYAPPPAVVVPAAPPPVGVAPAPYAAAYVPGPYPGSVVVNPYTGRWCTIQPDGWHWCWTP